MTRKKFSVSLLTFLLSTSILAGGSQAIADQSASASIIVNDVPISFEAAPENLRGSVMVPIRPIFEALQADLTWDEKSQTVIAVKDDFTVKIKVGSRYAYVNDKAVVLGAVPYLAEGSTMVPVRFVSEALGAVVDWSPSEQRVTVTTAALTPSEQESSSNTVSPVAANYVPTSLNIQFVPSQSAETLLAKSKPLEKLISNRLGIPVSMTVAYDYNAVMKSMQDCQVDIGFLPPTNYIIAHDRLKTADLLLQAQRYAINADTGSTTKELANFYQSMIVVRADSPIQTMEDLKGKKIGFQYVSSAAGYTYPSMLLRKYGIDPEHDVESVQFQGHDKAVIGLLKGQADAVAIFQDARVNVLRDYPNVLKDTRIIAFTEKIPNDTIVVRNDMDLSWRKKIQEAIMAVAHDPVGKKVIFDVYAHVDYKAADDKSFDIVREANKQLIRP